MDMIREHKKCHWNTTKAEYKNFLGGFEN